jgi:histidinol phosphatase-like PHP family hydrolase
MKLNLREDYHVHCNYNDHSAPDLTIKNVVMQAEKVGLQTLAFTEHVRKSSEWVPRYLEEIQSMRDRKLKIIPGFEAKILRDGSVDCADEYASKYLLVASFHTTYGDKQVWIQALKTAITNPDVDVIGHLAPEPSFALDEKEIGALADLIIDNSKTVELNAKYQRPPAGWLTAFKREGMRFHLGSDAHSLQEVGRFEKLAGLISLVND